MESLNPHTRIKPPTYFLQKPEDCKYYKNEDCLGARVISKCAPDDCKDFLNANLPQVITLCGSTRFKDQFFEAARDLTLQGWIVLMPLVFAHSGDSITDEQKQNLDELHLEKIRLSNAILVLNIGGYIGESTRREIEYAKARDIPVYQYE